KYKQIFIYEFIIKLDSFIPLLNRKSSFLLLRIMKIGLISDTHGWLDLTIFDHFRLCDEIWHAGDIGTLEVAQQLEAFKPLRAVYGNIDGKEIRSIYPENQIFVCEGLHVWITHIGGRPPTYTPSILKSFK